MHFLFLNSIYSLGTYVVTLFVDGKNENKSTTNNESCITCFCEPKTSNCKVVCIITVEKYFYFYLIRFILIIENVNIYIW